MKEVLDDIERWRANGHRVALARVVGTEGSSPRDPGATMAVSDDGEVAGSVSGGCVEGAVVTAALEILAGERDRGEPAMLEEQMSRLARVAHKVVWVNPLKASPGYAPLAQGMAAALPYVDAFVEGHSLAALERVMEVISQ